MQNEYYDVQKEKKPGNGGWIIAVVAAVTIAAIMGGVLLYFWGFYLGKNGIGSVGEVLPTATPDAGNAAVMETPEPGTTARPWATLAPEQAIEQSGEKTPFSQIYRKYADAVGVITVYANGTPYGYGSCFVIYKDGYLVTNNHIVAECDAITVTMHNGKEYKASLVGTDSRTEVALIKIEPEEDLTVVTLGDSDQVQVGEYAISLGNPLGYESSISVGVISGTNRVVDSNGNRFRMLQADISTNSGNSGGPMFNIRGEVIGLNTMKEVYNYSSSGYIPVEGIALAVPSNTVKKIVDELITTGKVTRAALQVQAKTQFNSDSNIGSGAYIDSVVANGAADKAGIKSGDVIVKVDGTDIATINDLTAVLQEYNVGDTVTVALMRDGAEIKLTVTLGASA